MLPSRHMLRRSTLWGAACIFACFGPAAAQLQTTLNPALPSLGDVEKDPGDPDATYCRPPQIQPGSRLAGPKVCLSNRQWDRLHKEGMDISADGKNTVPSEKYRTLQGHN